MTTTHHRQALVSAEVAVYGNPEDVDGLVAAQAFLTQHASLTPEGLVAAAAILVAAASDMLAEGGCGHPSDLLDIIGDMLTEGSTR